MTVASGPAGVTTAEGTGVRVGGVVRRVGSTVVLAPAFMAVVLWAPAWLFAILVVAVSGRAAWELASLFTRAGRPTWTVLATLGGAAVTASFTVPGGPVAALAVVTGVVLCAALASREPLAADRPARALLGVTWIGLLLGHGLLLHARPDGAWLVLFLVGVTWIGESAAYLVGSTLGRRPLAPRTSPKKTVEGALAQLACSVLAGMGLGLWLLPGWSPAASVGGGLVLGLVGQAGDLAESAVKRGLGAKDAGELIPGHGGLLDRVDGLLFNTPAFYYFALAVGGPA